MGIYIYVLICAALVAAYVLLDRALRRWRERLSSPAGRIETYRRALRKMESRKQRRRQRIISKLASLEQEYARNPENERLGGLLLSLYAAQRDTSKLKAHCLEVITRNPRNDLAASAAFALAGDDKFFEAASREYEKALDERPDSPYIWLNLASLRHARSSRVEEDEKERYVALAGEAFRKAAALSPEDPGILWSYGVHLESTGKLEDGLSVLQRVRNAAPELTLRIGRLLRKLGRSEEARSAFVEAARREEEKLGRIGPTANAAYGEIGMISLETGDDEDALGWLRKQTPTEPHTEFLRQGLDLTLAAGLLDRATDRPEVRQYIDLALLFTPDRKEAFELARKLESMSSRDAGDKQRQG